MFYALRYLKMNDYLKELGELAEINEPVRETYYKGNERIDEVTPKYALLSRDCREMSKKFSTFLTS